MIKLAQLQQFFSEKKPTGINGIHFVVTDDHASTCLSRVSGCRLVVTYPSAIESGEENNNKTTHAIIIFIVEKKLAQDNTEPKEIEQYSRTANLTEELLQLIKDSSADGCSLFVNIAEDNISLNPEYNIFGGWNGWSITMVF